MAAEKAVYESVAQREEYKDPPIGKPPKGFGVRHTQALLLFVCLSVGYSLRAHLSVSMVAMTRPPRTACHANNLTSRNDINPDNINAIQINRTEVPDVKRTPCNKVEESLGIYRRYDWDKSTQEMILYSFFVGYTSMMIPMGILAQRFGGKIPILIALGANGVLSILTPWAPIVGGWISVCLVRLAQGMTQAAFYPSIHTMLGRWAPLTERGRLCSYVYTGSQFGTVVAFQLAGLFAGSPQLGWPASFWLGGAASLACCAMLAWLGAATPHEHSYISAEELAYITGVGSADVVPKRRRTPWRHILTSRPVWGLVASHAGSAIGYLLILTQIPLYMDRILGVDIKTNGVFSSLPYIAMYMMILMFGNLSDFCVNRKIMSILNIRIVTNSIGMVGTGFFLIAFGYVKSTLLAIILLVLCLGTHSGVHVGFHINHIDLAPNFAGPIMALGNMLANLSSLMAPVLVSNIIGNDVTNQHSWQILFIIIAAVMIFTNLVFVLCVRATVQPWNFYGDDDSESAEEGACVLSEKSEALVLTATTMTTQHSLT